jgi:hypothetical protein
VNVTAKQMDLETDLLHLGEELIPEMRAAIQFTTSVTWSHCEEFRKGARTQGTADLHSVRRAGHVACMGR